MPKPLQTQDPSSWLVHAAYYNGLWHQCDDSLRTTPLLKLSETENNYYKSRRTLLLNQKQNCQLTALRLTYSESQLKKNSDHDIVLVLDPHEKGVSGESVFYSLYSHQQPNYRCHIPYSVLLENLTTKEQDFFNL